MTKYNLYTYFLILIILISFKLSMGQWVQLNGPVGGYVRGIIFDGEILYAASGGGVLVSDDQGDSWAFRNSGLKSCDTKSLAQLGDYVFISTDENVFRTNDQGLAWEQAGNELDGKYIKNLSVANNILFAATYLHGIYRSADTGNTWTAINNGFSAKYAYYLATDGSSIFAGTYQDGLYRSIDMGNSWESVNYGLTDLDIMAITCFDGKVFLSTLSSGVYVSMDNGESWNPLGTNIPSVKGFAHHNGILYAASFGNGVYISMDSGQTWNTINTGLDEANIWAIGISDLNLYVGVTSGHIYKRSISGGNWSLSCSIGFNACVGTVCSSGQNLLAGTHGSGFHASVNAGDSWTRITSIWTVETRSIISSNQFVFAGTDMLGVFKSTNNGGSFSMSNEGLTSAWIQAFAICQGELFAGSGEEGVFISHDAGSSWIPVNTGLRSLNISSMSADEINVFAGTTDSGVFITSDLGENWFPINNGLNSTIITAILSLPDLLFAGTKNEGLFRSSDNGENWIHLTNGIPQQTNVRCLHAFDNKIFVGTGEGEVYVSFDNGETWTMVNEGLAGSPVLSLWVFEGFLYAGINAGGVWKYPLSLISRLNEIEINKSLSIFPNPSANQIKVTSNQKIFNGYISVYDLTGQQLIKQHISDNRIIVDINILNPGIYLINVHSKNHDLEARFIKE